MSSIGTATKKPALTPINTGNAALDNFVRNIIQIHQVEEGLRGKGETFKLDKKPSYRELVALGLVVPTSRGGNLKYAGDPVDGFKPGNGADPVPEYSSPSVPQNVTATGGFGVIFIEWDDPLASSPIPFFAHAEIWRSSTNNLGTAVLLATTISSIYSDKVGSGLTYYYWVRFVKDVKGTVVYGPFNATAGTAASSADDPEYIIGLLNKKITETELFSTLSARIDLIDGSVGLVGSVDARINAEAITRADQDVALANSISTLGATVDGNTSAIVTEQTARASADSALASDITTLQTTVGNNTSSISTLTSTTNGLAAEFYVKTDVNGYVAGFGIFNEGPGASGFLVNADLFAVGKFGQTDRIPFIIATVNGITRIALDAATFIPDATITQAKIGTAAITSAKIADAAIVNAKIADASITSAKIGFLQVTNALIGNVAISTAKIEDLAVSNAKIGNLAVDTLKIANEAVTVPAGSSINYNGFIPNSWITIDYVDVNWGSAAPAAVMVTAFCNYVPQATDSISVALRVAVSINGGVDITAGDVGLSAVNGNSVIANTSWRFTGQSGSCRYKIQVFASVGGKYKAGGCGITALGVRK